MSEPDARLTEEQRRLPPEWIKLDAEARVAESILKNINPGVEIEWVKEAEFDVGTRRVIQLRG